jgi:hypothetical protein
VQQQCRQAQDLGLAWQQPRRPQRLVQQRGTDQGRAAAAGVALGEQQGDHRWDGGQPFGGIGGRPVPAGLDIVELPSS